MLGATGGTGLIFIVLYLVVVFAMLGMLSPASRGSLMTAIIFLYVFMGWVFQLIMSSCDKNFSTNLKVPDHFMVFLQNWPPTSQGDI